MKSEVLLPNRSNGLYTAFQTGDLHSPEVGADSMAHEVWHIDKSHVESMSSPRVNTALLTVAFQEAKFVSSVSHASVCR